MHPQSIRRASVRTAAPLIASTIAALVAGAPAALGAQLPNASPAAFGLGENFLAAARGADAAAWNPANLGLRSNPGLSIRALAGGGISALSPVSWNDVSAYGDQSVSREVRQRWLDQITADGGETGDADGGVTLLALSAGRIGFHVGGSGYARARMSPDAAEALFFGNAGRTGQLRELRFGGSSVRGGAFATTAVSYGQPIATAAGRELSLGITAKYVVGGGMVRAEDAGSSVTSSNVAVAFPVVHSSADGSTAGSGMGVDLGAAWSTGRLTLGAKVENVVNTFKWDETALRYRAGSAAFDGTTSESSFDEQPFSSAPQALRGAVADERFAPALGAGLAFRRSASLLVTADARYSLGGDDAIVVGPKSRVGLGVESRALGWLPVRVGGAVVTGGWQAAAGAGIKLGAYELSASYMMRDAEYGSARGVMVNVVSVR